ncbi:MAG: AMP-binding protein [Cellulomonadaceae bacterium]|jgi:long-chain acyl-CoA synthetase|nr:AMP-binding protein [Cellulomonadaceae bacterium]
MDIASTPNMVTIAPETSINTMLANRVRDRGDGTVIERRAGERGPFDIAVSATMFDEHVMALAKGFIAYGINPGDRVAIMSHTRYEWTQIDYALWAVGAVPVPVYETSAPDQVEYILNNAGARLILVENQRNEDTINQVRDNVPSLTDVLVIDKGCVFTLSDAGRDVTDEQVRERSEAVVGSDLATIIYTSGSTGRPKGVELTHGNFVHVTENARAWLPEVLEDPGTRTILFLPLAHVFARLIEVAVISSAHCVLGHTASVRYLVEDLNHFKPSFLLAVPRVFEKVYNTAAQKASSSALTKNIFHWADRAAKGTSHDLETGKSRLHVKLAYTVADKLVLSKIRASMGGNVKFAISGGAPLGTRLGHFYRGLGVTVLEGYGLTETCAPSCVNTPSRVGIGTVGEPLPGTQVRIDSDGEILLHGPHLFRGYHDQPELTAEVLTDGWFHTGDIGMLDDEGRLKITGRKKELIVTAGGKNVAPAILEDRLRSHPLVSQVVVVGDQRPFIGALVTLDTEMLPGWLATHDLPPMSVDEARENPVVLDRLQKAVDRANRVVSRAESIRKFTVLHSDFTERNGYLTPSMKVKRHLVLKDFSDVVDDLYGGPVESEETGKK